MTIRTTGIEELFDNISKNIQVRESLKIVREQVKEPEGRIQARAHRQQLVELLHDEDAKTRRLAAQILGTVCPEEIEAIFKAYQKEDTLFIRPGYLEVIKQLDYKELLPQLKECYQSISVSEAEESLKVHLRQEATLLYEMIVKIEGMKKHTFLGLKQPCEVLLTTKPVFRDVTMKQIADIPRKKVPLGVMVKTDSLEPLFHVRSYEELLFYFGKIDKELINSRDIAKECARKGLCQWIFDVHKENYPMGFRIQWNSRMYAERRGDFVRQLGQCIQEAFHDRLFNTTGGYEVELRFVETQDEELLLFVKLFTIRRDRFDYRKQVVASSIKPYVAAGLMQLVKPYLTEEGQILDPYCGVGTMLIERRMAVRAKDTYGIDYYKEAIDKARLNSKDIGEYIHYIHKDFADFTHEYPFDEIITNMPVMTNKVSRQEVIHCYEMLFLQAEKLLRNKGRIILYGNEHGTIKRLLRQKSEFTLLWEGVIDKKMDAHLYVIEYK